MLQNPCKDFPYKDLKGFQFDIAGNCKDLKDFQFDSAKNSHGEHMLKACINSAWIVTMAGEGGLFKPPITHFP